MCKTVLDENLRRTSANVDYTDALSALELQAWRAYVAWDPSRGINFEGYCFSLLRRRVYDHYRELLGRNGEKPLSHALSFEVVSNGQEWGFEPPDPDLDDVAEQLALRARIEALSASGRETYARIGLRVVAGWDRGEIVQALEAERGELEHLEPPVAITRSWISARLDELRAELADYAPESPRGLSAHRRSVNARRRAGSC
jgi:hypothetical protein